jgi:hypothetical protein
MKIKHSLFLALVIFMLTPLAAGANEGWEVVIRAARLPKYFDYPTTSLNSIVKLSVGYQPGSGSAFFPYETLYYNGGLPIGCTKVGPLSLQTGQGGTIRVDANNDNAMDTDECNAIANAAGRMFLDLYLKKFPVYDVVVPGNSFDDVITAFQRTGFYQTDPSNSPHLVLSVVSNPPGRCEAMAF